MDTGSLSQFLTLLDLSAAAVFAVSGALVASRKEMDIVGFLWLGVITGVGGGTVRDVILDAPVFWIRDEAPLLVCIACAVLVYFTAHKIQSRYRLVLWLDAAGLAIVTVAGASKGLEITGSPVIAVVTGILTGTMGGIIRDTLGQEPSVILRREIYVTASLAGAICYVLLTGLALDQVSASVISFGLVFVVRGMAITMGLALPIYKSRPGKDVNQR
jgi:uncharacterized membrane protein YeiH